jgi:hypothetical protein
MTVTDPGAPFCPRALVDHIDFVAREADGHGDWILADRNFTVQAQIDHVEDTDRIAPAIGHVRVFAIVGRILRKLVRPATGKGRDQQREWKKAGGDGVRRIHGLSPDHKSGSH